jgi:hypothetical protein
MDEVDDERLTAVVQEVIAMAQRAASRHRLALHL